jgi:hypothetical protein
MAAVIGYIVTFAAGFAMAAAAGFASAATAGFAVCFAVLDMVFPFECFWRGIAPVMQRSGIRTRLRSTTAALLAAAPKSTFVFAAGETNAVFLAAG